MLRWRRLAALAPLVALAGLALAPRPAAGGEEDVARWLDALRGGDMAEREVALEALAGIDDDDALRAALATADPDVRFYLLHLLQEDAWLRRLLRTIVEGHEGDSGTYPAALEAFEEVLARAVPRTRAMLVRVARRHAGSGARAARYRCAALDLLWDLVERDRRELEARDAVELAKLLEVDLRDGFYELSHALAFFPPELSIPAVRAVLDGGSPLARARAARVLASITPAEKEVDVARSIGQLLEHERADVRLAALQALDLLRLEPEALIPAARRCRDEDPKVAGEALWIAAERGLRFVRETAESLAADRAADPTLRRHALAVLGVLGEAGSAGVLRAVGDPRVNEREIVLLAAWARCGVGDPKAAEDVLELIDSDVYSPEDILYFGLARLDEVDALAALTRRRDELSDGERRSKALAALGRCVDSPRRAAEALRAYGEDFSQPATSAEFEQVVVSLGDLHVLSGSDAPLAALGRLFLKYSPPGNRSEFYRQRIEAMVPVLGRVGGPPDGPLARKLSDRMMTLLGDSSLPNRRRGLVADAFAIVDPEAARRAIRSVLVSVRTGGFDERRRDHARDLARSLARAGDNSFVESRGLAFSREQLARADSVERGWYQNAVGIDLLYARRLDEAIVEFRRMLWCDPRDDIAAYNVACGYALQGRKEEALRYLRRSMNHGYADPRHMSADPDLDVLRGDPRFERLLRRLFVKEEVRLPRPHDTWPMDPGPR